jgi:hypothetical protein
MKYSTCPSVPACKGKVTIDTTYSLDVAVLEDYKQKAQIMLPLFYAISGVFITATVIFFVLMLYFRALWKKTQGTPNSSGMIKSS